MAGDTTRTPDAPRSDATLPEAGAPETDVLDGTAARRSSAGMDTGDAEEPAESARPRPLRRVLTESIALGAFAGVATVVAQRLLFGQTNMAISIGMTVLIEVVYFKTLAKRF